MLRFLWQSPAFSAHDQRTVLLLVSAAFGIPIQFLLQFHGLALTTVSHASLMVGSMPVLLAAAAALFAGERLTGLAGWRWQGQPPGRR